MFEAWTSSAGDVEALLEHLSPEIEWTIRSDLPEAGTYRGHDGIRELVGLFDEALEEVGYEPGEYIDAGEKVVVPLQWWGRGRGSGAMVSERQGETWVFTVREGMIVKVTEYRQRAQALEAVGLGDDRSSRD